MHGFRKFKPAPFASPLDDVAEEAAFVVMEAAAREQANQSYNSLFGDTRHSDGDNDVEEDAAER